LLALCASGCGGFAARRMAQAPNTYPTWFAPKAPVTLQFSDKLLTAFTNRFLQVDSPEARIRYRVIEPADYQFSWTNEMDEARGELNLNFSANVRNLPEHTNQWTAQPRGTVVLLHGYGVAGFAMLPWALLLGQEGWQTVLVDLRGHGKSTGKRIYFGSQEVSDLSALLNQLDAAHKLAPPVSVIGDSYGAVVALKWKMTEPRIDRVVAISPYADLSNAVLNISRQYASWIPQSLLKAGLHKLPELLRVKPSELNPESWISWLEQNHQAVLFVAGGADKIAPLDEVERLYEEAGPRSKLLIVPKAAHEPLPFYFDDLAEPITRWLEGEQSAGKVVSRRSVSGG
jgi:pimeloyl-ACP methyl ester carboxylesterase